MVLYLIRNSKRPSRICTSSTYHSAAYVANAWFAIVGMKSVASPRGEMESTSRLSTPSRGDQAAD